MDLLVQVSRGTMVESVHHGVIAVVDGEGKLIAHVGDPQYVTYIRSAAKPLQAIAVLKEGAGKGYNLQPEEIAIMTASHSGEPEHIEVVKNLLLKIGLDEFALQCGVQKPTHAPSAEALLKSGAKPGPLHCNCSGKHGGMLALAQTKGLPLENYYQLQHPVQQIMLDTVAKYCDFPKEKMIIGIDGCGVPVFGMPIYNMAKGYANLVKAENTSLEVKDIVNAMTSHPFMVAGTNRLCTSLMAKTKGKFVAKVGAEGVYCIGVRNQNIGIAIKVADGNIRALGPIAIEVLKQLALLTNEEIDSLKEIHEPQLKNMKGEVIGGLKANFTLQRL
jgi:L-asparaginase II